MGEGESTSRTLKSCCLTREREIRFSDALCTTVNFGFFKHEIKFCTIFRINHFLHSVQLQGHAIGTSTMLFFNVSIGIIGCGELFKLQ